MRDITERLQACADGTATYTDDLATDALAEIRRLRRFRAAVAYAMHEHSGILKRPIAYMLQTTWDCIKKDHLLEEETMPRGHSNNWGHAVKPVDREGTMEGRK